mmetsp:Transcript_60295/g.111839  ORF Transcript_60295/g.111839 Transcript_60295/m.111839 type:complete len:511 (+) Transcript_60295:59-1591(+)
MSPAPGTTIQDPVTVEHKPDLRSSLRDITEYFEEQGAYDLFDHLLKELIINKPVDPLQYLIDCLQTEHPCGPLKVIITSAPGLNRSDFARRLAATFGLVHISASKLMKSKGISPDEATWHGGVQASWEKDEPAQAGAEAGSDGSDEVAKLVMEEIRLVSGEMKGWVLDGFPRTRQQSTYMKEACVTPTHVLMLKAPDEFVRARNEQRLAGEIAGEGYPAEVLDKKLRTYGCHSGGALEPFRTKITVLDATVSDADLLAEMERVVRILPKSTGPRPPARVVIFGPRGVSVKQHASRLAAYLGAVFVDGEDLKENALTDPGRTASWCQSSSDSSSGANIRAQDPKSSIQVGNLPSMVEQDKLGIVGVRLRSTDCKRHGWVLCSAPSDAKEAGLLKEDADLRPSRVIVLDASVSTCIESLRHQAIDPVTGEVWNSPPDNEVVGSRLVRRDADQPEMVQSQYEAYAASLPGILQELDPGTRLARVAADRDIEAVFKDLSEFVERPLPLTSTSKR